MKENCISEKKFDKMAVLAFANGLRLHFDSILLFKNKSFPSAYFLSVLAVEEIGKAFILDDFLYHYRADNAIDVEFLELMFSHTAKQLNFAYNLDFSIPTDKHFKSLFNKKTETAKQNSLYVGLSRKKEKLNLKSRIINPLKLSRNKTFEQITTVNDCLLDLTLSVIKQIYGFDSDSVEHLLNKKLYSRLINTWWYVRRKTKVRLKQIDKI